VPAQLDLADAVLLGRKDFTVQSIDAVLGQEKWNVTFSQLSVMAPAHPAANADHGQLLPQVDLATAGVSLGLSLSVHHSMSVMQTRLLFLHHIEQLSDEHLCISCKC